jgi:cell division protein FtsB
MRGKSGAKPRKAAPKGRKSKKRNNLRIYVSFWIFLIVVCMSAVLIQRGKTKEKELEALALEQQLEAEKLEEEELKIRLEFKKTDEYAESQAHSQLGWVYPDEIIFYVEKE